MSEMNKRFISYKEYRQQLVADKAHMEVWEDERDIYSKKCAEVEAINNARKKSIWLLLTTKPEPSPKMKKHTEIVIPPGFIYPKISDEEFKEYLKNVRITLLPTEEQLNRWVEESKL